MTRSHVCSVATHAALRADLESWLWLPVRAVQFIEADGSDPAEVLIHKQCEAPGCGGAIGKLVPLVGELADVYATLVRALEHGSVNLIYTCRRALDGCELSLRQWRSTSEMDRMMDQVA